MKYYGTDNGINYGFSSKQNRFKQSVEISDAEHRALLDGQANGKRIATAEDGHPYLSEYDNTPSKEQEIAELQRYLDSTDWYAIRYAETGTEIPDDITKKRQETRDKISELRSV